MNARPNDHKPRPALIKKLTRHGNSLALVIDKPILDLLGIDADTELEITTDGGKLHLTPRSTDTRRQQIGDALERVNRRHGGTLKRLAE